MKKRKFFITGLIICLVCIGIRIHKDNVYADSLIITKEPISQTYISGQMVELYVEVNTSNLSYEWQYSFDGATWTKWDSSNGPEMRYSIPAEWNGIMYRCIVRDGAGNSQISDTAKLVLNSGIKITENPQSRSYRAGEEVSLEVTAEGTNLSYEWQYSFDGTTWTKWDSSNGPEMRYSIPAEWNGIRLVGSGTIKFL